MDTSLVLVAALLGSAQVAPPPVTSICDVATGKEAKAVVYFRGDYGVLGTHTSRPYTGRITLSGSEDSEALEVAGTVNGKPRQGIARYVRCGPDRVRQLEITFGPGHKLYCVPHLDYDNLNRASCTRRLSDPNGDQELWYQRLAP